MLQWNKVCRAFGWSTVNIPSINKLHVNSLDGAIELVMSRAWSSHGCREWKDGCMIVSQWWNMFVMCKVSIFFHPVSLWSCTDLHCPIYWVKKKDCPIYWEFIDCVAKDWHGDCESIQDVLKGHAGFSGADRTTNLTVGQII